MSRRNSGAAALAVLAFLSASAAHAAPARIGEAEARAFVERQSRSWNAGDLAAFFGLFTADATFTDQARARDGRVVPYGTSSLAEAKAQARRARAAAKVREITSVRSVQAAPDGRSARITAAVDTTIVRDGRTRRLCAEREQRLIATPAGLRSKGQTDTYVRCG